MGADRGADSFTINTGQCRARASPQADYEVTLLRTKTAGRRPAPHKVHELGVRQRRSGPLVTRLPRPQHQPIVLEVRNDFA